MNLHNLLFLASLFFLVHIDVFCRTHSNDKNSLYFCKRFRLKEKEDSYTVKEEEIVLDAAKTAVIICDMWDVHYCKGFVSRVSELAPNINEFIVTLRNKGVLIIHAPSGCLDYYKNTPAYQRCLQAKQFKPNVPFRESLFYNANKEGAFPIDDKGSVCDCEQKCSVWWRPSRQVEAIVIDQRYDAIGEGLEIFYLLKEYNIQNVIMVGVSTNMCVMNRLFGIRQMVYQNKNIFLVRDLTDSIYNSRQWPYVDHFKATNLVIEHIEKYWCPTISSDQILGSSFWLDGDKVSEKIFEENPFPYFDIYQNNFANA